MRCGIAVQPPTEFEPSLEEQGSSWTRTTTGGFAETVAEAVASHAHCQQRTLGLDAYTEAVLDERGFDVVTSTVECCGMAGSFGYKSEDYELSMDVGGDLQAEFSAHPDREVLASGTSCIEQLDALFDDGTRHPVEPLDPGR